MVEMTPTQASFLLALAGTLLLLLRLSKVGQRPKDFPPGPPTLPIIGNLHLVPSESRHLQFHKWAKEYGPIYSVILGTQTYVVLNEDYVIRDLVDKRGHIYGSRPEMYIGQDMISGGLRPLFMPAGPTWKTVRKLAHRILKIETARTYIPYQDLESKAMLLSMLDNPQEFINNVRRYGASLTTQMSFGFRTITVQDPKFTEMFDIFDEIAEMTTAKSAVLLDFFPFLRHVPAFLWPIKKRAAEIHKQELALFKGHYLMAKKQLADGTAKPSFCVDLVRLQKEEGFTDNLAAYISGSLLQAGSETTSTILMGFIQAMVINPAVAQEAQAEIDRVCGDRLPDLNDYHSLIYIRACVKETLRWQPAIPLSTPHATTMEDNYMGYRIPKKATVLMNAWAIHKDPRRYTDPEKYNPSRYLGDNSTSAESANSMDASERDHFAFGAGRRRCVGMHIADRSLFLSMARLLWAFDFKRVIDPVTGQEIVPDKNALTEGLIIFPKPFPADIVPRSPRKANLVQDIWNEAASDGLDEQLQWKKVPEGLIWQDYDPAEYTAVDQDDGQY